MATNDEAITIQFRGNASNLMAAVHSATTGMHSVKTSADSMSAGTVAAGVAMGQVMVQMAEKVAHFAGEFVSRYAEIGAETTKLIRMTGDSAENMSKLRFAAEEMGVSNDTLVRGFRMLSAHMGANDQAAQALNVSYKNADGTIKPMSQTFGEVADKLNAIEDPMKRNALGAKLFGRSYLDLMPLLRVGSENIKEFGKEAEKMGLVLSEKNVADVKKFTMSKRQMHAAISGVQVAIGKELLPTLAGLTAGLTNGIVSVKEMISNNVVLKTGFLILAGVVAAFTTGVIIYQGVVKTIALVTKGWQMAQKLLNAEMALNPIGLIVVAIVGLIAAFIAIMKASETFRHVFELVMGFVGNIVGKVVGAIVTYFRIMADTWMNIVAGIAKGASWLGDKLHIGWLKSAGEGVDNFISDLHGKIDSGMSKIADVAWNKGGEIGTNIGKSISQAIVNLKLPEVKMPTMPTTEEGGAFDPNLETAGSAADKAKAAAEKAKKAAIDKAKDIAQAVKDNLVEAAQATLETARNNLEAFKQAASDTIDTAKQLAQGSEDYWKTVVDGAKSAMDDALNAAKDAADQMQEASNKVASAITSAFDITNIFKDSGAIAMGKTAFFDMFKKRLDDAKEFVADLKKLSAAGLAPDLLAQLANAGPANALDTARMLLGDTSSIMELNKLQEELTSVSAEGGKFVGETLYGANVVATSATATTAMGSYQQSLANAAAAKAANDAAIAALEAQKKAGIASGEAAVNAAQQQVHNATNINISVTSPADAQDIANQVAWAISTGANALNIGGTTVQAPTPQSAIAQSGLSAKQLMFGI